MKTLTKPHAKRPLRQAPAGQKGAGLIEVLVTVLILATSLLAMGALQSRSLQFNHSAYLRSQANIIAYDILDRMRINKPEENLGSYDHDLDDAKPGAGGDLAQRDLNEWLTFVERNLPGGKGAIDCDNERVCTITLEWVEQDSFGEEVDPEDGQETTTFTYSTRI